MSERYHRHLLMTDNSRDIRHQPEDLELAAAIAAVTSFMDIEAAAAASAQTAGQNHWRAAGLVEGVRAGWSRVSRPAGWNSWKAVMSFSLLLSALGGLFPASAAELSANNDQSTLAANPIIAARPTDVVTQSGQNSPLIRVALAINAPSVQIEVPDGAVVFGTVTAGNLAALPAQSRWTLTPSATGTIAFQGRGSQDVAKFSSTSAKNVGYIPSVAPLSGKLNVPAQLIAVVAQAGGGYLIVPNSQDPDEQVVACNGKLYRGALLIRAAQNTAVPSLNVINVLDVEDYLLSVLPSEMPCTWVPGALQAQAIAARSYAFANMGKHGKDGYDLKATTEDQVYLGVASERQSSNDAVAATSGLVIKHCGKPISAFFHSTSGGCTETAENVFSRPLPYLKSVIDYDDNSPHFAWNRKMSADDIEKAYNKEIGRLLSVEIISRTSTTNRAQTVLLTGSSGTKLVTGNALRLALKLPSSNFNIGCEENIYTFAGRGFGHGLGMSQYGAKALAEQGYNAAQILAYYYKDVSVEYVAGAPGI